jgi:glycine/D-amino acid oxidase-like deaminating enzyme
VCTLHSHVLATAPLDRAQREKIGWIGPIAGFSDDRDRIAFASMTARGELVFGGGSNAAYTYVYGNKPALAAAPASAYAAMEKTLRAYFPGAAGVPIAHRWSGPLAITLNRAFAVGVRGDAKNVYYALGYSGHGIVLANLAGRILADLYDGEAAAWRELPFFERRFLYMPPEPVRWLGYQIYTRLTGRSPRR